VDLTGPTCDFVYNGVTSGIHDPISFLPLIINGFWSCRDEETAISGFVWGLGTAPGLMNVMGPTSTGVRQRIDVGRSFVDPLRDGEYYHTLLATNVVGLTSTYSSPKFTVITRGPICESLSFNRNSGSDVVTIRWICSDITGVRNFYFAIGTHLFCFVDVFGCHVSQEGKMISICRLFPRRL